MTLAYHDGSAIQVNKEDSWIQDGDHFIGLTSSLGLVKISSGSDGSMPGKIVAMNSSLKPSMHSMMLFKGKIYLRHEDIKPAPFVNINRYSLQVEKLDPELKFDEEESKDDKEKTEPKPETIQWLEEDKKTGRALGYTPLITDGNMLYVISLLNKPKKEDKDDKEDKEDEEKEDPKLVLETYDPDSQFKFVKKVTLTVKEDKLVEPFKLGEN